VRSFYQEGYALFERTGPTPGRSMKPGVPAVRGDRDAGASGMEPGGRGGLSSGDGMPGYPGFSRRQVRKA